MEKSGPRLRANRRKQTILLSLLRSIREEKGLRQIDVANALNCPQSVVSKFEAGERRLDVLEAYELCNALGVTFSEFARRLETALKAGGTRDQNHGASGHVS